MVRDMLPPLIEVGEFLPETVKIVDTAKKMVYNPNCNAGAALCRKG
jgi:hypothetical protein